MEADGIVREVKIEQEDICEVCQKTKSNMNEVNWKRHKDACEKKKKLQIKRKNTFESHKMTKFFKTTTASAGARLNVGGANVVSQSLTYQYQKVGIRCKDHIKVVIKL